MEDPRVASTGGLTRICGRLVCAAAPLLSGLLLNGASALALAQSLAPAAALPDAPSAILAGSHGDDGDVPGMQKQQQQLPLCPPPPPAGQRSQVSAVTATRAPVAALSGPVCIPPERRLQPIISRHDTGPLNAREKGLLAARDVIDPFNLLTIGGYSAASVGINPHSAYGPGMRGWGRLSGYSLLEDAQGEFFGTFAIPALVHQDPRYRRDTGRPVLNRLGHAIAHTFVAEKDDRRPMPNYATLLTYPISAELSNLYVPGIQTNAASTVRRIGIGLATDPAGNIVAEFLPDFARRIHIRVVFIQEILNQVATGRSAPNVM